MWPRGRKQRVLLSLWCVSICVCHDVLNLFSDLFSDNNQNLSFFSEFIFNSHYMFRRSGPGHMLLHTVQKQKVQGRISLSLVKVKVKFAQTEVYKDPRLEKIDPLRGDPAPSMSSWPLHAEIFLPLCRLFTPSDSQGRAGSTHVGRLAALLMLKMVMVGKGTRTLLDVDVAW